MNRTTILVDNETNGPLVPLWREASESWWLTEVAADERAARNHLSAGNVDLVLVNAASVDAGPVLSAARALAPGALRVVLLADGAMATGPELTLSHQAIRGPFTEEVIEELVDLVQIASMLVESEELREMVGNLGGIPALPDSLLRLNELLLRPDVSLRDVADEIVTDIGLSTEILRIVNSSYFGISRRITDMAEAVAFLGLEQIRSLATSAGILRTLDSDLDADYAAALMEHGLETAKVAADLVDRRSRADAFCAGLLHIVGDLAMEDLELGQSIRTLAAETMTERTELEERSLGATHAQLGAYLLLQWGLPLTVVAAVTCHHDDLDPTSPIGINEAVARGCHWSRFPENEAAGALEEIQI